MASLVKCPRCGKLVSVRFPIHGCKKGDKKMTKNRFSGVQNWMFRNAGQYETATELAEAAADVFNLYENDRDRTIPERVFELAVDVLPTE